MNTLSAAGLVALASIDPRRLAAIMSRESEHVVLSCWCYADGDMRSADHWYINRSWVGVLS